MLFSSVTPACCKAPVYLYKRGLSRWRFNAALGRPVSDNGKRPVSDNRNLPTRLILKDVHAAVGPAICAPRGAGPLETAVAEFLPTADNGGADRRAGERIRAFARFGGVPAELLFDQMRAVVLSDDRSGGGELVMNAEFLRFAAHWGFMPCACRPYRVQLRDRGREVCLTCEPSTCVTNGLRRSQPAWPP